MSQFVYMLEDRNTQLLKIGISIDPEFRAKQISKDFSADAFVAGILAVEDAQKTEQFLHSMLAERRVVGEWFELDDRQRSYLLTYFTDKQPPRKSSKLSMSMVLKEASRPESMKTKPTPIPGQELINTRLRAAGLSRSDLAAHLGISRQVVTRTLNSTALINARAEHWPAILDALGLEVVVQVKPTP